MKDLHTLPYDPEFEPGAHNAVFTCLAVRPGERAVLITDDACLSIGAALLQQLEAAQAEVAAFVLEEHVQRPTTVLPEPIARALEQADVSVFAACAQRGELPSRVAMTAIVNRRGIRHGHMVNITPRIMVEGMRADFRRVDALCRWVLERVRPAHSMTASSPSGTRLTATFSPAIRWIPTSGIIGREKWGNLPGGEVFTSPLRVDGVFVVDGVLGDWLANKYGRMEDNPLRMESWRWAPTWRSPTASVRSCRTRSCRASTSPSATPTPSTRGPTGPPRRTWTWWAVTSTSTSTGYRSCATAASW
jgi:hypothetical protein